MESTVEHPPSTVAPHLEAQTGRIRYGWLNALIIGATITVWLSLVGMVVVGVVVGVSVATRSDSVEIPGDIESRGDFEPTGNSRYFQRNGESWWRDMNGDECPTSATVVRPGINEAVCP
jgi:hypothetical protein